MSEITAPRLAVIDEHVLARAFLRSSAAFTDYPRPPARSSNEHADALGVIAHHAQWGLAVSPAQLKRAGNSLAAAGMANEDVARFVLQLQRLAVESGGGVFAPEPETAPDVRPAAAARAASPAEWVQADACVLADWSPSARDWLDKGMWLTTPRIFADKGPWIEG